MYSPERMPRLPGPRDPGPSLHVKRAGVLSPGRQQLKPLGASGKVVSTVPASNAEAKLRRPTSRGGLLPAINPLLASHPGLASGYAIEQPLVHSVPNARDLLVPSPSPPRQAFSDPQSSLLASRRAGLEKLVFEYTPIGMAVVPTLFAPEPVPPARPKPPTSSLPMGLLLDLQSIEAGKRQEINRDEQLMWRLLQQQHLRIFASLRSIICECEEEAVRRAIERLSNDAFAELLKKFESQSSSAKQAMMLRQIQLRRYRQGLADNEERMRAQLCRELRENLLSLHLTSVDVQSAMRHSVLAHEEASAFRRISLQRYAAEESAAFQRWMVQWLEARHAEAQRRLMGEEAVNRADIVHSADASHLWLDFLPPHETAVRAGIVEDWQQFLDGYFAAREVQRVQAVTQVVAYDVQAAYNALLEEEEAELFALYQQMLAGGGLIAVAADEMAWRGAVEQEQAAFHAWVAVQQAETCERRWLASDADVDRKQIAWLEATARFARTASTQEHHLWQEEAAHRVQVQEECWRRWSDAAASAVKQLEAVVRRELEAAESSSHRALLNAADQLPRRSSFSDLSASFVLTHTMQLQVVEYDARTALDATEMDARVHLYVYEASERFGDYDEEEDEAVMSMVSGWPKRHRGSIIPSPFRPASTLAPPLEAQEQEDREALYEGQRSEWLAMALLLHSGF
eukprot:GGOE01021471.1.p1 GENE.GGOE01021471.1~~GGOE01021471.1.p1  ORF type:complete len:685 (-),score=193.33 GGOE01021471.1:499-2553(-)